MSKICFVCYHNMIYMIYRGVSNGHVLLITCRLHQEVNFAARHTFSPTIQVMCACVCALLLRPRVGPHQGQAKPAIQMASGLG